MSQRIAWWGKTSPLHLELECCEHGSRGRVKERHTGGQVQVSYSHRNIGAKQTLLVIPSQDEGLQMSLRDIDNEGLTDLH